MARLLVFRGETLERELELARLPLRIGRGSTNDLVLEDPVKSVSREHAEIHLDGDRYVLVDRQSENGIWVAGTRCPTITFDSETVATIGPFRLKVEGSPSDPSNELTVMGTASGAVEGSLHSSLPKKATPPPQPMPIRTASAPQPARQLTRQQRQRLIFGGGAALVAIIMLVVGIAMVRSSRRPAEDAAQIVAWISQANLQMGRGACAEALAQNIEPGLAREPDNPELLSLKQQADRCLTPTPPPPSAPPDPITVALRTAREMIDKGECAAALSEPINGVLNSDAENAEALALKAEAEKCVPVTPVRPPPVSKTPMLAKKVAPEDGGLEPLANEGDVEYQSRITAMRARYDDAVATASKGPSLAAIRAFEVIVRDATPRYLDAAAKLAEARRAYRATAQQLVADARELAAQQKFNDAIRKYRQALDIDSSLAVDVEIRKIEAEKLTAGQNACRRARQLAAYMSPEAPKFYQQVLELLPADEPCYAEAKEKLNVR